MYPRNIRTESLFTSSSLRICPPGAGCANFAREENTPCGETNPYFREGTREPDAQLLFASQELTLLVAVPTVDQESRVQVNEVFFHD